MANIINFSDYKLPIDTHFELKNGEHSKHGRYISTCRHFRFEIDEGNRVVRCNDCGDVVDPFNIMIQFAEEERRFFTQLAKNRAAVDEFERIQSEWSLTIAEKRRIKKVIDNIHHPDKSENIK